MGKTNTSYQQEYYRKNRTKRLADCKEYHGRNKDHRNAYNREYYQQNKHKWPKRTREQQDKHNATRRERYANEPEFRDRIKSQIKEFHAENPLKKRAGMLRKYGLTLECYDAILKRQRGGCAICGAKECKDKVSRSRNGKRRMHVDHCHATGTVRGILCSNCNLGLGKFLDDPRLLEWAAVYLRSFVRDK